MSPPRVTVVTFPLSESGCTALTHLIQVIKESSPRVNVVTGKGTCSDIETIPGIHISRVEAKSSKGFLARSFRYFWTQVSISRKVAEVGDNTDVFLFFIGGPDQILSIMKAKLMRKRVIIAFAGSSVKTYSSMRGSSSRISAGILKLFQALTCSMADRLVVYSDRLLEEYGLERWRGKSSIAHEHFLDEFDAGIAPSGRPMNIGYIGRLSEEKGVLNLITAMDILARGRDDLRLTIIGDGQKRDEIAKYVFDHALNDRVVLLGAIPHSQLSNELNKMKLIVIPSYTEGLPNVMLEAMSCGTPVLASSVGSIPDYVRDGHNGFLMEGNSPPCIARNIQRAVDSKDLDQISERAMQLVQSEFTFSNAAKRYGEVLNHIVSKASSSS